MNNSQKSQAVSPIWLRIGLAATPVVAIGSVMLLAAGALLALHRPLHLQEMVDAAVVSVAVGLLAVAPMVVLIGRSAILLLRCAVLANMTRLVGVAVGAVVLIAFSPVRLEKTVVLLWLAAFYFVLLIAESVASSWVIKHSKV